MNKSSSVELSATNPFAAQFAVAPPQSLINTFNSQVGLRAWSSQRALHNTTIIAELVHRGIDVSSVYDGTKIDFAHHIALSTDGKHLIFYVANQIIGKYLLFINC